MSEHSEGHVYLCRQNQKAENVDGTQVDGLGEAPESCVEVEVFEQLRGTCVVGGRRVC